MALHGQGMLQASLQPSRGGLGVGDEEQSEPFAEAWRTVQLEGLPAQLLTAQGSPVLLGDCHQHSTPILHRGHVPTPGLCLHCTELSRCPHHLQSHPMQGTAPPSLYAALTLGELCPITRSDLSLSHPQ